MSSVKFLSMIVLLGAADLTHADQPPHPSYPVMAPLTRYLSATAQEEIDLARTAAPASISAQAEVLVLGEQGYRRAVAGTNGFVCFVERSWTAGFDDREFWNPRTRGPNCFNPPAARSVLPQYLKRTEWAIAGMTREQMMEAARTAVATHQFGPVEAGSLSFMLSKQGYLGDAAGGPWAPHVMFFLPHGQARAWAASLDSSPVLGTEGRPFEPTVLFIPVGRWSDGSLAAPLGEHHHDNP